MLEKNQFNTPSSKKKENSIEKLQLEVRIAMPEEWKILRDLRLKILEEEGSKGNIASPRKIEKMKRRTDEEWKDIFFGKDKFSVLAFVDGEEVGEGRAEKKKEVWYLFNLGVGKEFRGKRIGAKLTAIRINEIKARGGKEIRAFVKEKNKPSFKNMESFGFKKDDTILGKLRNMIVIDDANNPITTKRIEEVLNTNKDQ